MDPINAWLDRTHKVRHGMTVTRERVVCADGFTVSIQAGRGLYCRPRHNYGPYDAVELGYPSEADDLISRYAEDKDNPTKTVYPWVPVALVGELLLKHGGAKGIVEAIKAATLKYKDKVVAELAWEAE